MGRKMNTRISKIALWNSGFTQRRWTDRNDPKDTFDTLKFIEFEKIITKECKLSVTFSYKSNDGIYFKPLGNPSVEFYLNDESVELNITNTEDVLGLFFIFDKIIKPIIKSDVSDTVCQHFLKEIGDFQNGKVYQCIKCDKGVWQTGR